MPELDVVLVLFPAEENLLASDDGGEIDQTALNVLDLKLVEARTVAVTVLVVVGLYLIVALAAPLVVYFGPDVLSPAAPAIATAAADGRFSLRASNQHALDAAPVRPRDVIGHP